MDVAKHCIRFSWHPYSVKVAAAPIIDGTPEALWNQATAMTVNVAGGANMGSHVVTLKSIYTDDSCISLRHGTTRQKA